MNTMIINVSSKAGNIADFSEYERTHFEVIKSFRGHILQGDVEAMVKSVKEDPWLLCYRQTGVAGGPLSFLHYAVGSQKPKSVAFLLDQGMDLEESNGNGMTPLSLSLQYNAMDIAHLLLSRGANIKTVNYLGETTLHLVARHSGQGGIIRHFVDRGVNPDDKNNFGYTALDVAAHNGLSDNILGILQAGCDLDIKENGSSGVVSDFRKRGLTEPADLIETWLQSGRALSVLNSVNARDLNIRPLK